MVLANLDNCYFLCIISIVLFFLFYKYKNVLYFKCIFHVNFIIFCYEIIRNSLRLTYLGDMRKYAI